MGSYASPSGAQPTSSGHPTRPDNPTLVDALPT